MSRARVAIAVGSALLFQFVVFAPVHAVHEEVSLHIAPETDRNGLSETHRLTATVFPAPDGGAEIDFKVLSGPHAVSTDPQVNKQNMDKPDRYCTIRRGDSSCFVEWDGSIRPGTDVIVAWIDHDGENITVEADKDEGRDAGGNDEQEPGCPEQDCGNTDLGVPGGTAEPDGTDVVEKEWGQLGARKPPFIDGSTEQVAAACNEQRKRVNGDVVSVAKGCSFGFLLASESDPNKDYGAVWAQTTVNPRRGWCVVRTTTSLAAPDGSVTGDVSPSADREIGRQRTLRTMLIFGPQTGQSTAAYLEQTYLAYPGSLTSAEDATHPTVVWRGKTRRTVANVLGAEVAWASDTFPDFPGATTLGHRVRRCSG